jgi:hypothetical protein
LIAKAERSVARLTVSFRKADNDIEATALEREGKIAAREWESLAAECAQLEQELGNVDMTPEKIDNIRRILVVVKSRLGNSNFNHKRDVINLLNFSTQVGYKDGQRGLWATCLVTPDPKLLLFDNHSSEIPSY